jgi:hypothetical protein
VTPPVERSTAFPAYGKDIRIRLSAPPRPVLRAALALAVPPSLLLFAALSSLPSHIRAIAALMGVALLALLGYAALSVVRLATWKDLRYELTKSRVTLPTYPVWRQRHVTLDLVDIDVKIGALINGIPAIVVDTGERLHRVPLEWFPADWPSREIAFRTHVRAELRKRKKKLSRLQLAAIEAQLDHPTGLGVGAVVLDLPEGPVVTTTIGDDGSVHGAASPLADAYAEFLREKKMPGDSTR